MDEPTFSYDPEAGSITIGNVTPEEADRIEAGVLGLARAISEDTPERRFGVCWGGSGEIPCDDSGV